MIQKVYPTLALTWALAHCGPFIYEMKESYCQTKRSQWSFQLKYRDVCLKIQQNLCSLLNIKMSNRTEIDCILLMTVCALIR